MAVKKIKDEEAFPKTDCFPEEIYVHEGETDNNCVVGWNSLQDLDDDQNIGSEDCIGVYKLTSVATVKRSLTLEPIKKGGK